jgi:hypothetical protein
MESLDAFKKANAKMHDRRESGNSFTQKCSVPNMSFLKAN